jgi:DNA-binding NtrC family response regulator
MANPGKSSKLKVLYGEGNAEVLASQAVSIQNAGHQVETAVGRKAVEEAVRKGSFDLVVLGPSLTKNDRHHLPYIVKKVSTGTRVLVMHTDGERHPYVDGNIDTGRSIEELVEKIATIWSKSETPQGLSKGAAAGK